MHGQYHAYTVRGQVVHCVRWLSLAAARSPSDRTSREEVSPSQSHSPTVLEALLCFLLCLLCVSEGRCWQEAQVAS